ncbi:hypothetical protein [Rufibacter roseus]|uniref:DUF3592 domain-containing protein n=1 Tax=Rufibacter roseus TaxID=1567108 RepID=A0ABW2DHS2_9BACT|nr:hypothetical protein [Rufibacter roseus]
MAQRRKHSTGVNLLPSSSKMGRFVFATVLIVVGLVLIFVKDLSGGARYEKDLVTKEGTLTNYSFKKNEAGEKAYGIWLREFTELLMLPQHQMANFDTAAFKNQIKPGDRLQVQYNKRENPMNSGGTRTLYGLSSPAKDKIFFTGEETIKQEKYDWLAWLSYALIGLGTALFIYQIVKLKREEQEAPAD